MKPVKIAFVYMRGRVERLDAVAKGEAPTEFFYGALELARDGVEVGHFEIDPAAGRGWLSAGIDLVRRLQVGPFKTDGRTICQAAELCEVLNGYDLVVATASKIAFAFGLCAQLGKLRTPILGIQCGLLNQGYNPLRKAWMRRLLADMHSMLFGDSELAGMRAAFALDASQLSVNQFGVDTGFWAPAGGPHTSGEAVVSVGNDGRRDFDTLLAAAAQIGAPLQIVTSRQLPQPLPSNVTHLRGTWHEPALSDAGLRAMYQQARCVVVPLKPGVQPSGQSVALQAMACGRPVVLTETEGLWSREMMRDEQNVLFCRAGDPAHLAAQVRRVIDDPALAGRLGAAARQTACELGNIKNFAAKIRAFGSAPKG